MAQASSPLHRFIDDELARAPLLIDQVLQQLLDEPPRFSPTASSAERRALVQRHDALQRARPQLVKTFMQTLREQVEAVAKRQADAVRGVALADADEMSLSLVDDAAVAIDVALQHTVAVIQSTAEYELRELGSFTSALVGDLHVAHDTNPFRPEAYAQALLAAARVLPADADQLWLMRQAAAPLAQALRLAYASAAGRLEAQGVEPGTYRTIILPPQIPGRRASAPPPQADLHALRDSMPVPLDFDGAEQLPPSAAAPAPAATPPRAAPSASSRVDQQLIELLTRLFDAILADRSLPQQVQLLLSRLQASAVRVALRDPAMLDSYDHPVWEFMDRLAFEASRHPGEAPTRERLLRYTESLIDHMVREPTQDAALYRWGIGRLDAFVEHVLGEHSRAVQPQIDQLRTLTMAPQEAMAQRAPPAQSPLDVGTLDTVPAELIDVPVPSISGRPAAPPRLPRLKPGEWLHLFLQGEWRELQLLWCDGGGEAWLFRQPGGRTWALRRSALERLNEGGLLETLEPPSLVQHAAQRVLRQVPKPTLR